MARLNSLPGPDGTSRSRRMGRVGSHGGGGYGDESHAHLDPSYGPGGREAAAVVAEEGDEFASPQTSSPPPRSLGHHQQHEPRINSRGPVRLIDPNLRLPSHARSSSIRRSPTPHSLVEQRRRSRRRCVCALRVLGAILLVIGGLGLLIALLSHTVLPTLRDKKVLQALVVDSRDASGYDAWVASDPKSDSPMLVKFFFFDLLNPGEFLKGNRPSYQEVGPWVFEQSSQKVDVTFSDDGDMVSYVALSQNRFRPDLSNGTLSDEVTLVNLPYATAVATVGSERNLLRVGARGALKQMRDALLLEFLPTMKENAAVFAATKAIKLMQDALGKVYYPADGVATRWGGGCVTFQSILNHCGFSSLSYLRAVLDQETGEDLTLWQLCLETHIDNNPGRALPLETVKALWNQSDPLALFNTDRLNTSVRYGVNKWLRNDPDDRDEIMQHFKLNDYQYGKLQEYISRIYNSPILERYVLKAFRKALKPHDAEHAAGEILGWEDLVWRQWTIGDVVQVLNEYDKPSSLLEENPPELAWYMHDQLGVPMWDYDASAPYRWSNYQAKCFFNASLSSADYFQETVLGIPLPPNKSPRTPFNNPPSSPLMRPIEKCMVSEEAWTIMRGYIDHVAEKFVRPVLEEQVIHANGGLIVTRPVGSWLEGRREPILALSLEPDDPRVTFSLMSQDASLSGPGVCAKSNDVENPITACKQAKTEDGRTVYYKTPNTYHTGKRRPERMGALALYRGEQTLWGVWPKTTIPILGGAAATGSHIQYGFSEGLQFPPFNRVIHNADPAALLTGNTTDAEGDIDPHPLHTALRNAFNTAKQAIQTLSLDSNSTTVTNDDGIEPEFALAYLAADSEAAAAQGGGEGSSLGEEKDDVAVWLGKFLTPLRFRYHAPVKVQGVGLRRFDLSPATYSPKRKDAKGYSMDGPEGMEGLLNVTDLQTLPMFLSPPQYFGLPELRRLDCLRSVKLTRRGMLEAAEGSYISIEPYTGRAMQAHIAMQISTSTNTVGGPRFDVWYPHVYKAEVIPTLWMAQGAEVGPADAALFKSLIYKSDALVKTIQASSLLGGIAATGLGLLLLLITCLLARPRCGGANSMRRPQRSASAAEEGRFDAYDDGVDEYEEGEDVDVDEGGEEFERQRGVEMARVHAKRTQGRKGVLKAPPAV